MLNSALCVACICVSFNARLSYDLFQHTRTHARTHLCRVFVHAPQEDVSHHPGLFLRGAAGLPLHRADGRGSGRQQALPLRLPPLLVAGGRQGRPAAARQVSNARQLR